MSDLTFPPYMSEFPEVTEIIGTDGRITLEPTHCPATITIRVPQFGNEESLHLIDILTAFHKVRDESKGS